MCVCLCEEIYMCVCVWRNIYTYMCVCVYEDIYISGAETGLVLLVPGTTNNSVNVIQNGLKIIH